MIDYTLIENFKSIIRTAMMYAEHSHDYIFDDTIDDTTAMLYLNIAISKFSAAESLYYSRYEELQRGEAEDLFHLFGIYARELLSNYKSGHSHQWTNIEFDRLKECFDNSAFAIESK